MSRHRMRTRRRRARPRYPAVFGRVLSAGGRKEVEAFAAGLVREGKNGGAVEADAVADGA